MIEAQKNTGGAPHVKALCDVPECRREEVIACSYKRTATGQAVPDETQAHRKLKNQGWSHLRKKLRCPGCEAKRKAQGASRVSKVTEIRKPTKEQKREIFQMLEVAYDTKAGRYKGHDTDKTVSEALGAGVMPGWVAEVREDLFGPAGGSAEMDALALEIAQWHETFDREVREFQELMSQRIRAKQAEYQKRFGAIKKAVGPRASNA